MDAAALKDRHRAMRDTQPTDLRVRIHRAVSWLARAEREIDDTDARFLFLWIAFNAAPMQASSASSRASATSPRPSSKN